MHDLAGQMRRLRDWWFQLCTGHRAYGYLNEEHYRQRILVMTSCFWLLTVLALNLITPLAINLTPEGNFAAQLLFAATGMGVLLSMLTLRYLQSRIAALNMMLVIYCGAFVAACFIFGGTASPTYSLLLLAPVMAGIVGSIGIATTWIAIVLALWLGVLMAERSGYQFMQIIKPENYGLSIVMAYTAMAVAVVSVIVIYAEMNKALRTSLQQSNEELGHLSSHDQLTGLPNRRFYDERATLALRRSAERGGMTALLYLDLNDFKKINDSLGHGVGDKLLIEVARRMRVTLRETDLVARLGGDEFAAVIEDVKSQEQVARIAQKLTLAIDQPMFVRHHELKFSASIGVALFPIDGRQKQELEELADKAMYFAKKRGISVAFCNLESSNALWPVREPRSSA